MSADGYVETYRAVVAPAQCDHLGHMNVQHYFAAVSDGMFSIQTRLGLGPSQVKKRGLSFAVVHAETDFKRELVAGDVIRLLSSIDSLGSKSATFHHRLFRVEDDELAFETRFKCVLLDLAGRQAHPIPDDIRGHAESVLVGS
ncbi:MAG: acyl-CoA thioesterase [Alphaproteobacteria bacterium]